MALRIIRKSASQSQVELIRGQADSLPQASLLIFIDSEAQLAAAKALLADPWIRNNVECLLMKANILTEPLRPHFSPQGQTLKLLNEPKEASWSLRLRTLMQEASSESCLFLPFVPADATQGLLKPLAEQLLTEDNLALLGPALVHDQLLLAAGQDLPVNFAQHQLLFDDRAFPLAFDAQRLFYFYQGLPRHLWEHLAGERLMPSAGVPLIMAALRRSAYLSLNWSDQAFELPWLAQELAFALRQAQYQLAIAPISLQLNAAEAEALAVKAPPQPLLDTWMPLRKNTLYPLYLSHGLLKQGPDFVIPPHSSGILDPVAAYFAERSLQA